MAPPSSRSVLSIDGVAATRDHPAKSIAINIEDGAEAIFVFLRGGGHAPPPAAGAGPSTDAPPAPPASLYPESSVSAEVSSAVAAPPTVAAHPVEVPPQEPNLDDVLAARLEALKRG